LLIKSQSNLKSLALASNGALITFTPLFRNSLIILFLTQKSYKSIVFQIGFFGSYSCTLPVEHSQAKFLSLGSFIVLERLVSSLSIAQSVDH